MGADTRTVQAVLTFCHHALKSELSNALEETSPLVSWKGFRGFYAVTIDCLSPLLPARASAHRRNLFPADPCQENADGERFEPL